MTSYYKRTMHPQIRENPSFPKKALEAEQCRESRLYKQIQLFFYYYSKYMKTYIFHHKHLAEKQINIPKFLKAVLN